MKTRYVQVDDSGADEGLLEEGARILAAGGLVVFPTETVYGIAARSDNPETIERLRILKGRSEDKPFTIHVADVDDIFNFVRDIPPMAMRLINRFWPGPMTLILLDDDDKLVGLRWPDHPVAQGLLRRCLFGVIAPSVNPTGEEPANTLDEIRDYFDGKIDLVLYDNKPQLKLSSTIVKVLEQDWELLREGPVSGADIEQEDYTSILFVCTGNTCRSPMAEGLCRQLLAQKLGCEPSELREHGFVVHSAGTSTFSGGMASHESVEAMRNIGIDIMSHVPQSLSLGLIDTANHVLVMTSSHLDTILHWNPQITRRARLLRSDGANVGDPYGGPQEQYDACAREIRAEVEAFVNSLELT